MKADEKPVMAFLVYYRDEYNSIVQNLMVHPNLVHSKDGAKSDLGYVCPRMTVYLRDTGSQDTNRNILKALSEKLDVLKKSNKIDSYVQSQKTLTT